MPPFFEFPSWELFFCQETLLRSKPWQKPVVSNKFAFFDQKRFKGIDNGSVGVYNVPVMNAGELPVFVL